MDKICILVSDFREDYNDDFVVGIEKEANRLGYKTDVYSMLQRSELFSNNEECIYKLVDYSRYKGVVFVERSFSRHRDVGNALAADLDKNCPIPVISIGSTKDNKRDGVIFDDCSGMFESLTDHLIEVHECKNILFLGGEKGARNGHRIEGFLTSMEKHGLTISEDDILYGGYWIECAEKLAKNLAFGRIDKPDAVMCINDNIAYALVKNLFHYGLRVPEDILVTGFDGAPCAFNRILPITTIEADSEFVGRKTMSVLHEKITGMPASMVKPRTRSICLGLSCGCGYKKPADVRLKLDIQEKQDREAMEFRNSKMEERMFNSKSISELADILKNSRYLIPDCKCLGVSLSEPDGSTSCIFLTQFNEGDSIISYNASDIYPDGSELVDTMNAHILPLIFSEKYLGFMIIGYDEPMVYGNQAKEFNRILSNAIEIMNIRRGIATVVSSDTILHREPTADLPSDDSKNIIMASRDGYMCKINIDNIIYLEAGDRRVYLITKNDRYELKQKMFEVEQQLSDKGFLRISKSCIANLKKITSYKYEDDRTITAITTTHEALRVSRGTVESFKKLMS